MNKEVSMFNAAVLVCIPEKVVHHSPDGTAYYLPQHLGPLSIVNMDNRLLVHQGPLHAPQRPPRGHSRADGLRWQ